MIKEILMNIQEAYDMLFSGVLVVLGVLVGIMLIRAIIGPRITDRILSINMIGTLVISAIIVLSMKLDESYLIDVGLIYAMISFIAVLVLASIYIPAKKSRHRYGKEAYEEVERERQLLEQKGKREDDR